MTRERDDEALGGLAALVRQLPRDVPPPPALWARIAARLEPRSQLDHLAASLPTQIDPPEDLWPSIEARIAPHRRTRRAALALAVSLAAAAVIALGVLLGERHGARTEHDAESLSADVAPSEGAASSVGWALDAPAVAGDVAANLRRDLALVRDERLSIERAIAKEPDNVDLRELWAFTYETELELADACGRTVMEYQRERG